jgi:hypothetical protein
MTIKAPDFNPAGAAATEDGEWIKMSRGADGALTLILDRLAVHQLIIVE